MTNLPKEKMLCLVWFSNLMLLASAVAVSHEVTSLATKMKNGLVLITAHQTELEKLCNELLCTPARLIKSYKNSNFYASGFDVRYSEAFVLAHDYKFPRYMVPKISSLHQPNFVTINLPGYLTKDWKYDQTKYFVDKFRNVYDLDHSQAPLKLLFTFTKHKGEMGRPDILVIEDITKL